MTHVDLRGKLLGHTAWRLLRLPLSATLHDLHRLIQVAFEWEDDHLSAVGFGPTERRPHPLFGGPDTDDARAVGIKLADPPLRVRQRFWYIFDFGNNHRLSVSVMATGVHHGPEDREPRILTEQGTPPRQYPVGEDLW